MTEETKKSIETPWARGLYMLLFFIVSGLVKGVICAVALVQFILVAIKKAPNEPLLKFGQGLSTYIYNITQFLVFNTEHKPFPFEDWRSEPPKPQSIVIDQVND